MKYDVVIGFWGDGVVLFYLMGDWDFGVLCGVVINGGLFDD